MNHFPMAWTPQKLVVVACFLLSAGLYLPSITILPFSDDWQMSAWAEQHGWDVFFPGANFRFWTRVVFAAGHPWLDVWIGLLIIPLSLAALLGAAWILIDVARRLAPHLTWAPPCVAALYLFHPANVSTVIQVDTIGQSLADVLMLLCVRQWVFMAPVQTLRSAGWAVLLIVCTLFGKETALGVLAWIPVAAYFRARFVEGLDPSRSLRRGLIALLTISCGIALFFWIRAGAGTPLTPAESGRYSINLSPYTVLVNSLQLAGGGFYFGDAAQFFVFGPSATVIVSVLLSVTLAASASYAWYCGVRPARAGMPAPSRDLYVWASFIPPATMPMVLMGSVSELYLAGITPFVALIYGICLAELMRQPRKTIRVFGQALPVAAVLWGSLAVTDKISMRRDASIRAWDFGHDIAALFPNCGWPGRTIVVDGNLADTTSGGRPYSAFSVSNERLLRSAIFAQTDPFRKKWIAPAAAEWARSDRALQPSAAHCSVKLTVDGTTPQCVFTCEAGRTADSKMHRCRVLEERCTDTRR